MLSASQPLPAPRPRRVLVAGVSGVGKTTFARRIAEALGLPHTELDGLYHGPNWTPRTSFEADVAALAASPAWVTEWQYSTARPVLAENADLLVWLDLPFRVTLARVIRRTVRRARSGETLWNGNVEPGIVHAFTAPEGIVVWAIRTRRKYRREVPALEPLHPRLHIVRVRSQREADEWLGRL
jgi:adenylate kinase family enzyme